MKVRLALIFLSLLFVTVLGKSVKRVKSCYDYDTDYQGTNLNNGLEQRTDSEFECQVLCEVTSGCEGFTWASNSFAGNKSTVLANHTKQWLNSFQMKLTENRVG